MDARWSFPKRRDEILVCFDGLQVARFKDNVLIREVDLPRPLDLQLLQIRETHLGATAVPEWRVQGGSFYLGDSLVFTWLAQIERYEKPIFQEGELMLCFQVGPGKCRRRTSAVWLNNGILELRNQQGKRFSCRHPELVDQLLAELNSWWPNEAIEQCREFIKSQTTL